MKNIPLSPFRGFHHLTGLSFKGYTPEETAERHKKITEGQSYYYIGHDGPRAQARRRRQIERGQLKVTEEQ